MSRHPAYVAGCMVELRNVRANIVNRVLGEFPFTLAVALHSKGTLGDYSAVARRRLCHRGAIYGLVSNEAYGKSASPRLFFWKKECSKTDPRLSDVWERRASEMGTFCVGGR